MGTGDTFVFDADERNTLLAALAVYFEAGYGNPGQRPDWVQDLACPDGDSTSLDTSGVRALFRRLLTNRNALTFSDYAHPGLPLLAETANKWNLPFFVVPALGQDEGFVLNGIPTVTFHEHVEEANDRAEMVNGIIYTTDQPELPAEGCRQVERTQKDG